MPLRERVRALLESPKAPQSAALVALLLGLPSLALGELLDDHLLRASARALDGPPAWDRFRFAGPGEIVELRERGFVGWWAPDEFVARMLRPLSSLTHSFDYSAWPGAVWLMHLQNVLLYALLTWAVAKLIQRVHGPGLVAGVAALVFALDESHALTVMWIAGRNTMLAALFGILAIHAHLRWRDPSGPGRALGSSEPGQGRTWFAVAAPLCFALALAAGEAGLCSFGYILAWTLVRERSRLGGWLALAPYVAVMIGWRLIYVLGGFGVVGSGLYLDVGAYPGSFVARALTYPGSLAAAQLSLPVTDLLLIVPLSWIALTGLFVALVWALRPVFDRAASGPGFGPGPTRSVAGFWLLGMLFAAVPLAATIPTARLLLLVGTGGAALVGMAFVAWREGALLGRARKFLVGLILVGNLVVAPLLFIPFGMATALLEGPHLVLAERVAPELAPVTVILNLPGEIHGLYPQAIREGQGERWPDHVYTLYAGRDPLTVTRVDASTLELRCEAGWAAQRIDRFARDWTRGFALGDAVTLEHARVEVLEVTDDGRPVAIRVRFDRDLDALVLLGFDPELERRELAIGESITLTAAIGKA
jgi:hypothetical protein